MKHIFFLLLLLSCKMLSAQSLSQSNHSAIATRDTDSMKVRLQLNPSQTVLVDSANQKFYRSMVMLSPGLSKDERKNALQAIEQEKEKAIKEALTASQWQTYRQVIEERRQQHQSSLARMRAAGKKPNQNN